MKYILPILLSSLAISCTSAKQKEEGKGVDVDRAECSWNKTSDEAKEKCKTDPSKPTIAKKLDSQLNKDAKTVKKFFGIKGSPDKTEAAKDEAPKK